MIRIHNMLDPKGIHEVINVINPTEIIGYIAGVEPGDLILCWCRNSDIGKSETEDNFAQIVQFVVVEVTYYNNALDKELAGSEHMFSAKVAQDISLKTYLSILPESFHIEKPIKVKGKLRFNSSVEDLLKELE